MQRRIKGTVWPPYDSTALGTQKGWPPWRPYLISQRGGKHAHELPLCCQPPHLLPAQATQTVQQEQDHPWMPGKRMLGPPVEHGSLHASSLWDMPLLCTQSPGCCSSSTCPRQPSPASPLTLPQLGFLSECRSHFNNSHSPVLKPRPSAGHGLWFFQRLPKYQSLWFSTSPITCFSEEREGHTCGAHLQVWKVQANSLHYC